MYYGSYRAPRTLVWTIGTVIFILMMATAFLGLLNSPKLFKLNHKNNINKFNSYYRTGTFTSLNKLNMAGKPLGNGNFGFSTVNSNDSPANIMILHSSFPIFTGAFHITTKYLAVVYSMGYFALIKAASNSKVLKNEVEERLAAALEIFQDTLSAIQIDELKTILESIKGNIDIETYNKLIKILDNMYTAKSPITNFVKNINYKFDNLPEILTEINQNIISLSGNSGNNTLILFIFFFWLTGISIINIPTINLAEDYLRNFKINPIKVGLWTVLSSLLAGGVGSCVYSVLAASSNTYLSILLASSIIFCFSTVFTSKPIKTWFAHYDIDYLSLTRRQTIFKVLKKIFTSWTVWYFVVVTVVSVALYNSAGESVATPSKVSEISKRFIENLHNPIENPSVFNPIENPSVFNPIEPNPWGGVYIKLGITVFSIICAHVLFPWDPNNHAYTLSVVFFCLIKRPGIKFYSSKSFGENPCGPSKSLEEDSCGPGKSLEEDPCRPSKNLAQNGVSEVILDFISEKNINPVFIYENLSDKNVTTILNETRHLSGIYLIFNKVSLDYYIGSASTGKFHARLSNHLFNFKGSKVIKHAVNKYGISSFVFMILELFTDIVNKENNKKLIDLEDFYLKSLLPNYNILTEAGSSFGYKHTEIHRLNIKAVYSEKHRLAVYSEKCGLAVDNVNKGKSFSPSTIEAMEQSASNRIKPINSEESFQNMKKKFKAILVYNMDYTVYGEFPSIKEASKSLGSSQKTIYRALRTPKKILRRRWIVKYV